MTTLDPKFGMEMKRLREAKGISQRKLGELIGLDSGYISRIERGLFKPPSEQKIVAISRVLGADEDYMLSLCGKISSEVSSAVKRQPKKMSEAVKRFGSAGDWLGVGIAVAGFIGLMFAGSSDDEEQNLERERDWAEMMAELKEETSHLPGDKQRDLIHYMHKMLDEWELDIVEK